MKKPKLNKSKLHKLWSGAVRWNHEYRCQWCIVIKGSAVSARTNHAHHIVSKGVCGNTGRYEVENGMTLCYYCHFHRLKQDVDGYIAFRDAWLNDRGLTYLGLKAKYESKTKFNKEFYERKTNELKEMT